MEIFKRFVETSGEALGMADLEGRIFYANPTLCRLLGQDSPEDLYQQNIFAFYTPETVQRMREEILPHVQQKGQWIGELTLIDVVGRPTPTIENIFLLRDESGKPLCIANVITDISERTRLEQELRLYRDHLEELVFQRTAELQRTNALLNEQIEEHRRTEKELLRLNGILESTSDLVASAMPDGRLLYMNLAGRRLLGWNPEEPVSEKTIPDSHPPWAWKKVRDEGIPTALAHGLWRGETAILNRGGREVPVSQVIMIHRNAGGQIEFMSTIMRDISERKAAEKALLDRAQRRQEQNEILFSLLSAAEVFGGDFLQAVTRITQTGADLLNTERVSVWLYDQDYATLRCIDLFERSLKRHTQGEELNAAAFPTYTRSHRRGKVVTAVDVFTDPRTREIPAAYFQKSGICSLIDAPLWLEGRLGGLLSFEHVHAQREWTPEDERLVATMGTIISLSYETALRRRAEAVLRESEEKFRMIFQHAPISIVISDLDGRCVDVNERMCEKTGLRREDITGRILTEIPQVARVEDAREVVRLSQKLREQGWLRDEEIRLICPCTKEHSTVLLSSRVISLADKPFVISMMHDITERRRLEEQLLQSQKMEAVGKLAGGVAHDFNNLLTAILGNAELALLEANREPPVSSHLKAIQEAATSAADLTRQLLAFSRKQIIEQKVTGLNDLILNMSKMLPRLIGEDISLRWNLQPGLDWIKVDPNQIQQIILNLAVNARDAMPHGGILNIETANITFDEQYCRNHTDVRPGAYVMLAIGDTGTGMTKDVQQHIFEPFFTTKAVGKGTGLGLATVYGAVKQNGGTIEVYSEPGQGTCFKMYFPQTDAGVSPIPEVRQEQPLPGGGETVLLVEDDPRVLDYTRVVLEKLGYQVLAASSGEEALSLVQNHFGPIQVLFTDVVLPGMNGRQTAEQLQKERPGLKVLFSSGYTENSIVHHGVLEKGLQFISKPFNTRALAFKLREVLDKP